MEEKIQKLEEMLKHTRELCSHYHEQSSIGTIIRSIESKLNYYKKLKK